MTTKKILAVLLTVISTTSFVNANDSTYNKHLKVVPRMGTTSYKLIYQSQQEEPLYVSIKDEKGVLLMSERLRRTSGFILPLNLQKIETGTYQVEVKGKLGSVTETINHTSQADYLKKNLFVQKGKNGQFAVVGFNLGSTTFGLNIYDDQSRLIYSDRIVAEGGVLNKGYNLGQLLSKSVNMLIYHNDEMLIESEMIVKK